MAEIIDITPEHSPLALARLMLEAAPDATAGFYCLIDKDDALNYEIAGMQRKDILWAIERMKQILFETDR